MNAGMQSTLGAAAAAAAITMAGNGSGAAMAGEGGGKASKAKPEITPVTMQDGRVVEFVGKRKLLKEDVTKEGGPPTVRFDLRNGQTRLFTAPESQITKLAAHGAAQKIGDATAGLEDVDDMTVAIDDTIDMLYDGRFYAVREAGGMAGSSILLRAMVEAYPNRTSDQLRTFLSSKTQAQKLVLRASDKLKDIVARLEAEKAAKSAKGGKASGEDLLAELEGEGPIAVAAAAPGGEGSDPGDSEQPDEGSDSDDGDDSEDDAEGLGHADKGADPYTDADAGKASGSGKSKGKGGKDKASAAPKNTEVTTG